MYDRSSTKEKWTFMKYIKDFDKMIKYANAVRNGYSDISDGALELIQENFEIEGVYSPKFKKPSLATIKCKICQIVYYMFGYKKTIDKKTHIIFSPLANLLLDNINNKEIVSKVFLCMLFSIEFKHPYNKMKHDFKIRPFRLIFKLLLDPRLNGKLYHDEVFYYVSFLKDVNDEVYEKLIEDILNLRKMSPESKFMLFQENEDVLADSLHLWNYTVGTLGGSGIINKVNDDDNVRYGTLVQGNNTGRRSYKLDYVMLDRKIINFANIMINNYPYDQPVLMGSSDFLMDEIIQEMYNFYPKELIIELGLENEEQEDIINILSLTEMIDEYALNKNNSTYKEFEIVLCEAFNTFIDVRANVLAIPGTTDIECIYTSEAISKKFDVEAKSTNNKLPYINAGRLNQHRKQISSIYTIVITPQYVPAVLHDIKGTNIVILKSRTFSSFLYQSTVKFGRNISYSILDEIINDNFGTDITNKINEYMYKYLSVVA